MLHVAVRRPRDYDPAQGGRFEVHIEKGRGLHGDAAKPFEAQLEVRDGACFWTLREIRDVNETRQHFSMTACRSGLEKFQGNVGERTDGRVKDASSHQPAAC
jgi:hypothetical protein